MTNANIEEVEDEDVQEEDLGQDIQEIMEDLNFRMQVPEPEDRGYIGYLDDLIEVSSLARDSDELTVDDWQTIREFMIDRISFPEDPDEKYAVVRSMSMGDFQVAFAALMEGTKEDEGKKKNSRSKSVRSSGRKRGSSTKKIRSRRGRGR